MRRGFSLIEILIAVMVVTLGVLPVYYMITYGTRGISVGIREILAVNHAASLLELFKGLGWNNLTKMVDGTLTAKQTGWVIYDRNTHSMINTAIENRTGVWETSGTKGPGSDFFQTTLAPAAKFEDNLLPAMEVFYIERSVVVDCDDSACGIGVKVSWEPQQGEQEAGKFKPRSVELKSVVMK